MDNVERCGNCVNFYTTRYEGMLLTTEFGIEGFCGESDRIRYSKMEPIRPETFVHIEGDGKIYYKCYIPREKFLQKPILQTQVCENGDAGQAIKTDVYVSVR